MTRKIVPTTWLGDDEFIGTSTRRVRYSRDRGATYTEEEIVEAVYGWSKTGKSFFLYVIGSGHIEKIGTIKREMLLDFRKVTV